MSLHPALRLAFIIAISSCSSNLYSGCLDYLGDKAQTGSTCTIGNYKYVLYTVASNPSPSRCIVYEEPGCEPVTGWLTCTVAEDKLQQACTENNGTYKKSTKVMNASTE